MLRAGWSGQQVTAGGNRRRPLSPKAQLLLRLWVGSGSIAVGLGQALSTHVYPPGDLRGSPGFWLRGGQGLPTR